MKRLRLFRFAAAGEPGQAAMTSSKSMIATAVSAAATHLQVELNCVELRSYYRDVAKCRSNERQRHDGNHRQDHYLWGMAKPATRPSTTSINGTFMLPRATNPPTIARMIVECAGEPADLGQHINPSQVVPLGGLAPPCIGTATD